MTPREMGSLAALAGLSTYEIQAAEAKIPYKQKAAWRAGFLRTHRATGGLNAADIADDLLRSVQRARRDAL